MTQYEKQLFEVLINYIPKISNSLEDIVEELREGNFHNRIDGINDKNDLKMKKVIGYVRVSSLVQKEKGNSIPNQIEKIKSYCKLNGYELVDILKDDGISGMSKSKRKDYLKLIDIMEDRNIDGVVVNDLSRIGRKMSDVVEFVDIIKKKQIEFHSIKEGINNVSNVGGLIINILSSINQFEVEMLRNRISEVKQYKKSKDLVYGNLIYGKSKDGNRLID